MKVEFYKNNPVGFWNDTIDILCENEAQNSIMIKCAKRFKDGEGNDDWYFETVKDDKGSVILSASCTPPHNVVIYETGNKRDATAVSLLANELFNAGYILPGVTGEQSAAESFADCYAKLAGKNASVRMNLNSMRLDRLSDVNFAPGYLREITEEDLYYLPYWTGAFEVECRVGTGDITGLYEMFKNQVGKSNDYIWIDKIPVTMAGGANQMINGAKIGRVYTPPFYRNKGYSTSCVWHLSKLLLDRGNKFVCLFADADYPVSNKVYQKIGYRNVCLYQEIKFE